MCLKLCYDVVLGTEVSLWNTEQHFTESHNEDTRSNVGFFFSLLLLCCVIYDEGENVISLMMLFVLHATDSQQGNISVKEILTSKNIRKHFSNIACLNGSSLFYGFFICLLLMSGL